MSLLVLAVAAVAGFGPFGWSAADQRVVRAKMKLEIAKMIAP